MKNKIKVIFVLLVISSLTSQIVDAEEQYNNVWTAESPIIKSNIWFGWELTIDGEYIIVSEPYADVNDIYGAGKIYIYDFDGNLINTFQSTDPGEADKFGYRFDVRDGLLVAYESATIDRERDVGKVYVFKSDGTLQYTLQPQEAYAASGFGMSVAIGEEILLIAEKGVEMTPPTSGQVHIYNHDGEFISTILPPNPITMGYFGRTLEVGEGRILISQYGDPERNLSQGPGYVYVYDIDGTYLMTIESPEPEERASFGESISISEDYIVVGEKRATVNGVTWAGKVHIFNTEGTYIRTILSPNPDLNAWFGINVAISGDIIVVGEALGNITPYKEEGRAYVFNVDGTLLQDLTAPDPSYRAYFGLDVDIQDDIIVVGECWAEVEGQPNSGRLHFYKLGAPVKAQEQAEEGTSTVSETETNSEPSGGIPGYPLWSIGVAMLLVSLVLRWEVFSKRF